MTLDPKSLQYTSTHEWVHWEDGPAGTKKATVGLSDFAIQALTDLVHIELPEPGRAVQAGKPFGEVESVKAVSDLYSPVEGEVAEVNNAIAQHLDSMTTDPYGAGWLIKVRVKSGAATSELLDFSTYQKQCEQSMSE